MFLCELHEYEGGISIFGFEGGFPTTAPTSGQTVTVAMAWACMNDFLNSSQFVDLTTRSKQNSADLGTKFPSQYTVDGQQVADAGNPNYFAIYKLNTTGNGFVDSAPTTGYTALRIWNDLAAFGHKNIKGDF